jgi:protein-tyrosine-phosphatase
MAAGLLEALARSKNLKMNVRSAGLTHHPGKSVAPHAVVAMAEIGLDISGEVSKEVTLERLSWADLIVTVQRAHAEYLVEEFPFVAPKVRALKSDVGDPSDDPLTKYRETRDMLKHLLMRLIEDLPS